MEDRAGRHVGGVRGVVPRVRRTRPGGGGLFRRHQSAQVGNSIETKFG